MARRAQMVTNMNAPMKSVTAEIPTALYIRLGERAEHLGVTKAALLRCWIQEEFDRIDWAASKGVKT